jgi:hypothetical protein
MPVLTPYARLLILLTLLASTALLHSVQTCSAQQRIATPADLFAGETLHYKIDFWILRGSAEGELCFTKTPDGYTAYFEAETKGILKIFSGARKEIMESVMEYDAPRQRLRPRIFRETFVHNKKIIRRTIAFDYERGFFTCTRVGPEGLTRTTRAVLPYTEFEDMLSLYYNFRMGCYGPLRESGKLRVPVIMKEQPSFITIEFPLPGSQERSRGFSAVLTMERDISHAFSKRVLTMITPDSMLKKALVVDAYFFGDLEVNLTAINNH